MGTARSQRPNDESPRPSQAEGESDQAYDLRIEGEAASQGLSVEDYKKQLRVEKGETL